MGLSGPKLTNQEKEQKKADQLQVKQELEGTLITSQ